MCRSALKQHSQKFLGNIRLTGLRPRSLPFQGLGISTTPYLPASHELYPLNLKRSITQSTAPAKSSSVYGQAKLQPLWVVGAGFLAFVLAGFCTNPISFDAAVAEYPSAVESIVEEDDIGNISYYHLADIRKHGPDSERPWVTYKGRVYDITDWVSAHPGGEVILRAAGGSIEPYWDIFSIHKSQYVLDILDQFAIGWVHPDDLGNGGVGLIEDPFQTDPERDARMQILTERPFNAETPTSELADSFLTPNDVFYVRNHMWVPVVGRAIDYDITIELPNGETKKYTIRDLQTRFKQHSVTAVLQCSGNRRKDMTDHAKKTNGLQWTVGAISCAKWEGVRLRDVLADAGVPLEHRDSDMQHVQFTGLEAYGASIPIASALDPLGDVLLAFRMNDEPLPRDHGFPVRVIVPGHVAARCVKWLKRIIVSDEESNTPWQRKDYKCFGPNETAQDWDKYKSIQKMPVTSAITRTRVRQGSPKGQTQPSAENPSASSSYQEETWPEANIIEIEGYAYSGGGREVQRVDISLDGGKTWDQARLLNEDAQLERGSQPWCWKRWKYESVLQIKNDNEASQSQEQKMTVVVKATDDTYNTQPETHGSIYNPRGNLATAWHRVEMSLSGERKELTGAAERNVKNDS